MLSMGKVNFIGSIYLPKIQKQINMFNITRDNGGEVYQMVLEHIKRSTVICILAFSKMVLNMEKDLKCMEMEIIIKVNSLMECPKVMAATSGMMVVHTKEILNKD
jgi:hypothetical protein